MSLNSLQDDMSRRAASMAAMAKHAKNPQEIQAIQQRLVAGVQNGTIQPYVGIPLIQELTNKLTEAKAKMAQAVTGAGMPQPPQGGAPIAQQVMAQAAQDSQGVEALPSNLPQQYAGGGIIAFEDGGKVERYQNTGYTGDPFGMGGSEIMSASGTADPYVGSGLLGAITFAPDDPEWKRKLKVEQAIKERDAAMAAKPPATPAAVINPASKPAGNTPPAAPAAPATPAIPSVGMPNIKLPAAPMLTDYNTLLGDLPKRTKEATENAVKTTQDTLEGFDKPGFEIREEKFGKREAGLDKDIAIGRALNLISTGFGIAGSKERTLSGALGNEGRQGIADLIKGEAANRAAKDRLDDARDNFEQQKVAAKKGNYQAAQAAGKDAASDLRAATQLTMTGAHYGNTEALQRTQIQQQGILGLGQIQAHNAATNAQLQLGGQKLQILKDQIASGDKRAAAALAGAQQKAYTAFRQDRSTMELERSLKDRFGPNYMQNPLAQAQIQQAAQMYMMNAVPSLLGAEGGGGIPSFSDLYKATE